MAQAAQAAQAALQAFEDGPWGQRFAAITALWRRHWTHVIPFFAYPQEVRKMIYTTNAIESLNAKLRRSVRSRGHFPSDEAALKLIWLQLREITQKWKMPPREWAAPRGIHLVVLHTWGSALTHHPHVHGIVPGGGLARDADRWVPCKPGFFLLVRVLSRLFRRRFLEELQNLHRNGQLKFFGEHIDLSDADAFADWLMPLRQCEWVVYAKRPFSGPEQVLAYLSRYTHRVAISNSRLVALDDRGVTFRWKDYREHGRTRYKTMTLRTEEFMRRFLLHVLPSGFHRIRHYGLLANANRCLSINTDMG